MSTWSPLCVSTDIMIQISGQCQDWGFLLSFCNQLRTIGKNSSSGLLRRTCKEVLMFKLKATQESFIQFGSEWPWPEWLRIFSDIILNNQFWLPVGVGLNETTFTILMHQLDSNLVQVPPSLHSGNQCLAECMAESLQWPLLCSVQ